MNKPLEKIYLAAPANPATPASLSKHTARWNISPENYPQPNTQSRSSIYTPMECYEKSICQIIWTGNMALTTLNGDPLTAVCCLSPSRSLSQSLAFRYRRPSGPPVFMDYRVHSYQWLCCRTGGQLVIRRLITVVLVRAVFPPRK